MQSSILRACDAFMNMMWQACVGRISRKCQQDAIAEKRSLESPGPSGFDTTSIVPLLRAQARRNDVWHVFLTYFTTWSKSNASFRVL